MHGPGQLCGMVIIARCAKEDSVVDLLPSRIIFFSHFFPSSRYYVLILLLMGLESNYNIRCIA